MVSKDELFAKNRHLDLLTLDLQGLSEDLGSGRFRGRRGDDDRGEVDQRVRRTVDGVGRGRRRLVLLLVVVVFVGGDLLVVLDLLVIVTEAMMIGRLVEALGLLLLVVKKSNVVARVVLDHLLLLRRQVVLAVLVADLFLSRDFMKKICENRGILCFEFVVNYVRAYPGGWSCSNWALIISRP